MGLMGKPEEKRSLRNLVVDGIILIGWIFKK
jgi:hypothetical protein